MRKKINLFVLSLCVISITLFSFNRVSAAEVHSVETQGSIGFTGVYEPIGTPDPPPGNTVRPPVTEIAKPDGSLPQTNEVVDSWLIWLGITLLSFVFIVWKRKKQQRRQ